MAKKTPKTTSKATKTTAKKGKTTASTVKKAKTAKAVKAPVRPKAQASSKVKTKKEPSVSSKYASDEKLYKDEKSDVKNLKNALAWSRANSIPMFKNPIMEKFSHVHPFVPLFIYIPVIIFCLYNYSLSEVSNIVSFILFFLMGVAFWSITEYTLHRFLFHPPFSETHLKWLYFYTHGVHHEAPNDATRLVMPPGASIPLAIIFFFLFKAYVGDHYLAFYCGFLTGYLTYDFLHFATHFYSFQWDWFKKLKKHHSVHHFNNPNKNFGVSNSLWDYIFATKYRSPSR